MFLEGLAEDIRACLGKGLSLRLFSRGALEFKGFSGAFSLEIKGFSFNNNGFLVILKGFSSMGEDFSGSGFSVKIEGFSIKLLGFSVIF